MIAHVAEGKFKPLALRELKGNRNKYGAIKTEVDGIVFASKKEARRYSDLKLLLKAGKILNLEIQPSYTIRINHQKVCEVRLDFQYLDKDRNCYVVEDVKGKDNALSRLKRKLVEAQFGFTVVII